MLITPDVGETLLVDYSFSLQINSVLVLLVRPISHPDSSSIYK
jgi:hypothetical protein